ncbi:delta subunit of the central stalk of mitochondrial F1F0 ATP synthase, atp16 [Mycoemilia scoparia]|uniref:ATP synthase subunit delta, mitochondrial n=1 Tax=Mycoemilia scoparia TaxID=417184 RepID=A0A9W8A0L8_9FUNG|nr:delta subunit of the central stalk of mitochondrial F1F0 ATP synthase, atp16 [Mycoemilia scoparia]
MYQLRSLVRPSLQLFRRGVQASTRLYATEAPAASAGPGKMVVNFVLPHEVLVKKQAVNQVNLSAVSGDLGILADHVPTVEQLKPGIVEIIGDESGSGTQKWFVSGGFAIMNPDSSLNINAIEAFKLDQISTESVAQELAKAEQNLASAKSEQEKEIAAIEIEVYEALKSALA